MTKATPPTFTFIEKDLKIVANQGGLEGQYGTMRVSLSPDGANIAISGRFILEERKKTTN